MVRDRHVPVIEAALIGACAGFSALLLSFGITWLGSLRVAISDAFSAALVLPLFGFIGGLLAGGILLVRPEASGSGIPQVRAVMTRMRIRLDLSVAVLKLLGGVIALGSGIFLGREGPTVQVGAGVAAQLCKWLPTTQTYRRQIIAAGAAAGLAAAFSAPLAGVVFVIEELMKEFRASTVGLSLAACFAASLVEHAFSKPHKIQVPLGQLPIDSQVICALLFLALICGLFGAIFNRGILWGLQLYAKLKLAKPLKVALAGLTTGIVVSQLPQQMHNYAATRTLINTGTLDPQLVPIVFVCFFFLTLLAYGSGSPGGLFAPCLAIGSTLGFMVGDAAFNWWHIGSIQAFSLVGMAAFFAAVARTPLTAIVIVFEMTGDYGLILPLILSACAASAIADKIEPGGLYEHLMVWNGIHLDTTFGGAADQPLRAVDLMKKGGPTLQANVTAGQAADFLLQFDEIPDAVPVLSGNSLVGIIQADQLSRKDSGEKLVRELMHKHPISVSPHEPVEELVQLFARHRFESMPITRLDVFLGVVTRKSLVESLFGENTDEKVSLVPD